MRSRHYVNVVIAGKYQAPQWMTMNAAVKHLAELGRRGLENHCADDPPKGFDPPERV